MNENLAVEVIPESQPLAKVEPPAGAPPMTSAQAKVDAVAALTMSAYEKAATLEITPEESAKLQANFDDDAFLPGAAGKENLIYIEHAHLRDRFNATFGMGRWAIVPRNRWAESFTTGKGTPGERVYVEAMLVVRGCFVAEAVGAMEYYPKNESQNYGDAVEGAKTAAFRRCAKEFGVGLQAWKKEWCAGWWARKRGNAPKTPSFTPCPAVSPTVATSSKAPLPAPPKAATIVTLKAMIEWLLSQGAQEQDILAYAIDKAIVMPNETLMDWPLGKVGTSKQQWSDLAKRIARWKDGDITPEPPPEPASAPPASEPSPAPAPANRIVGLVQVVSEKKGTSKKGKPYVKVGVKLDDGVWYNSFSGTIAEICAYAKEAKQPVDIEFKDTEYGREILSCIAEGVTP